MELRKEIPSDLMRRIKVCVLWAGYTLYSTIKRVNADVIHWFYMNALKQNQGAAITLKRGRELASQICVKIYISPVTEYTIVTFF